MAKPQPKLSDMPRHIKMSIVDKSETDEKLSLRQVNRAFKEVVASSPIHYQMLTMKLSPGKVQVYWKKTKKEVWKQLAFQPTESGYVMKKGNRLMKSGDEDYRKAAVGKLFSVFKHSKVSVRFLKFYVDTVECKDYTDEMFADDRNVIFEEIGQLLQAKSFRLNVTDLKVFFLLKDEHFMNIVPYLEPGILKALRYRIIWPKNRREVSSPLIKIADTKQWSQLKKVKHLRSMDIPIDKCLHFEKVGLAFASRPSMTLKAILEKLFQKSPIKARFICWDGFDMTGAYEYVIQLEKWRDFSHGSFYVKNPYIAGKRVEINVADTGLVFKTHSE